MPARAMTAETAGRLGARSPLVILPGPDAPGYLAIDKSVGEAVSETLGRVREQLSEDWHLVHRLDRMTSGVLLLAQGKDALRLAHEAWPSRVEKTYRALVRGTLEHPEGVFDAPILENRTDRQDLLRRALRARFGAGTATALLNGKRFDGIPPLPAPGRSAVHPAGRNALTRYHVIASGESWSLLELSLATGRMHQIRVHLAHAGNPILGDPLYDPGVDAFSETQPYLNAARLAWSDPPGSAAGTTWEWLSRTFIRTSEGAKTL